MCITPFLPIAVVRLCSPVRDLTFFTTNQTKLAHARYVAEGREVQIKGFRQRTYHAGYTEPRLNTRAGILRASYESALAQLAKARFSAAAHPFVLEDTSVRIDALSTAGEEVPGVDVKYWMDGQTFENLDKMLRAKGNDRRATVRSDVLLHVPSEFRIAWGVDSEFIVFTGEQSGVIVETEHVFETNLVYPWLDNRTFNKWFVPSGVERPFGSLTIEVADNVDFRRKAFNQLFNFLETRRFFSLPAPQLQLQVQPQANRMPDLIVCGYTCSGKTTASQRLARRFGYLHIEASDFMYLAYYYRHGYHGPVSIGDFAEQALAKNPSIAAEKVIDYMMSHLSEPFVISGFRAFDEIELVKKAMATRGRDFSLLFVSAEESKRFSRMKARERPGDDLDLEEFRARDLQQQRMGLDIIEQASGALSLRNEGDIRSYIRSVDALVGEQDGAEIDVPSSLDALSNLYDVGLQEAILIALLRVWSNNEARGFYTTTKIASLIATTFTSIRPKHKDNVSRYFNQDFYAYYEISSATGSTTRRYRLSNTGYGMAISTLRVLHRRGVK